MTMIDRLFPRAAHTPVPRGLATDGPALLSYGFRPFFLGAGVWAVAAMGLWIGALITGWPLGGSYGAAHWHAHEMLFGYATAALGGFMLTAIPNWTGRLPVSGPPLLVLVLLWLAGRAAMLAPDVAGPTASAVVEALFLPGLAFVAGREIFVGRNWKNLKILGALLALTLANAGFHASVLLGLDTGYAYRLALGVLIMLIALVGGRIVPSFTRNWLARAKRPLPAPFDGVDRVVLAGTAVALAGWVIWPETAAVALLCAVAAVLQAWRLWRWRGWLARTDALVAILHVGYGFVPLGLLCLAASGLGWLTSVSALHVLTVGAIGCMTFAVMTRATLGHTGRPLKASRLTVIGFAALALSALARPLAEKVDGLYLEMLALSAALWIACFALFVFEYGPMLVRPRVDAARRGEVTAPR